MVSISFWLDTLLPLIFSVFLFPCVVWANFWQLDNLQSPPKVCVWMLKNRCALLFFFFFFLEAGSHCPHYSVPLLGSPFAVDGRDLPALAHITAVQSVSAKQRIGAPWFYEGETCCSCPGKIRPATRGCAPLVAAAPLAWRFRFSSKRLHCCKLNPSPVSLSDCGHLESETENFLITREEMLYSTGPRCARGFSPAL